MSSEATPLTHPPGLGVAPAEVDSSVQHAKGDDGTAGQGNVAKEPRVFPRRRPDLTDAEAERREAMRAQAAASRQPERSELA